MNDEQLVIRSPKITVARTILPHRVALMIQGDGNLGYTVLLEPEQAKQIAKKIAEYSLAENFEESKVKGERDK
jgi:hypothetical protein